MLDGTVARLEQCQTLSGKIFDSVCDRFVEAAWIGALIIIGRLNVWALTLAVGSVSLLLCRVLAHRLGLNSSKVTVTRFERIAALISSTVFQGQVFSGVIFMMVTIGTFFSCFQIILMVVRRTLNIRNASRPLI
jgi:phosphatidylglycerophosphate synthase